MIKKQKMKSLHTAALLSALGLTSLFLLSGCKTTGIYIPKPEKPATVKGAEGAHQKGEHLLSAKEYLRLAKTKNPPEKQVFQLKAVQALIRAGQIHEARNKIKGIRIQGLGAGLRAQKLILQAHIFSNTGNYEGALKLLGLAQRTRNLDPSLLGEIYRVRAITYLAVDKTIAAAKNLIHREKYIVDKKEITKNQTQIWKFLSTQTRSALKGELGSRPTATLRGWIRLALIVIGKAGNPRALSQSIKQWRLDNPKHPVEDILLSSLGRTTPSLIGRIDRIALLLPLSDAYQPFGSALKDGFMAMSNGNKDPDKPQIKIYDIGSNPDDIEKFYDLAVRDGAQFIVGPLGRKFVNKLASSAELSVPTLLLSHTDRDISASTPHVYQFGLQPEQEARQAAERAYLDGHRMAAVLYMKTDQSQRMQKAFSDHWQQLGGVILAAEQFDLIPKDSTKPDYTGAVKRMLYINESEKRKADLQLQIREKLYFFPRRRLDIDFVFIAGSVKEARQLKPLLNFYRAARLPVYATSRVFTGKGNPRDDIDLDGIMFGDMPWMLVGSGKIQDLRQRVQGNWRKAHSPWDRLYALGMDSYAIIPHLDRINTSDYARFHGVTSGLSISHNGRLQRQLVWAIFKKGVPRLLDRFFNYIGQFEVEDGSKTTGASDSRS